MNGVIRLGWRQWGGGVAWSLGEGGDGLRCLGFCGGQRKGTE